MHAERRFTIFVDVPSENGMNEESDEAEEATALLFGIPWELIHNGENYLFQGAGSVRTRRQLPNK